MSVGPWVRMYVSIKEKRVPGASYVGYPTLFSAFFRISMSVTLRGNLLLWNVICVSTSGKSPRYI